LTKIASNIESLWSSIESQGSDEQRQLVSAMQQAVVQAIDHYHQQIPEGQGEDFFMWRHEAIRPVSLCINSAELLLTDTDHPLDTDQCARAQEIFDLSMAITNRVNAIFDQRIHS
jgi:hypothetical protein